MDLLWRFSSSLPRSSLLDKRDLRRYCAPMTKIFIDDVEYTVADGITVLEAAQQVGIEIPRYCYHPGLPIDGNCRMCLVEIDKMPKPTISCNTRISEGMSVRTKTEKVLQIRKSVMEFLLLNHPLDCPECDQAGECQLQDYYMKHNMQSSRLGDIDKVHKPKMVELGPNVMLDAERCILCNRCVRFCNTVTHTGELAIRERGNRSEITTFPGKPLDNAYATCTVDICPVGALTSKDFRFKKRVWFLKKTESVCNGCATGCTIIIDHADGKVYRYRPRYNAEVNQYWMCDEGRLSYKQLQQNRITQPFSRQGDRLEALNPAIAMARAVQSLKNRPASDIAFIVSAQQNNETLQAVAQFRRDLFPGSVWYYTKRLVESPTSDNFLIKADKNPNTKGVEALEGCRPLTEWTPGPRVVIAFDSLAPADITLLEPHTLESLIGFVHQENALSRAATLILPIPNYWEEAGSFTNFSGRVQSFEACFEATGSARAISDYLAEAAAAAQGR